MQQHEIEQNLIAFITQELLNNRGDLELTPADDLLGTQLVDSLGVMRIVAFLEQSYAVRIPPADVTIENFITVTSISGYLAGLKG
ncbi:MAG: acyl carrier protein [Gammaproteobacteria bacterium]|nr:acyl carrier protein [Gammaproteobacteria bacterium]